MIDQAIEHLKKEVEYFTAQVALYEGGRGQIGTYDMRDGKRVDTTDEHIAGLKTQLAERKGWLKLYTDFQAAQKK